MWKQAFLILIISLSAKYLYDFLLDNNNDNDINLNQIKTTNNNNKNINVYNLEYIMTRTSNDNKLYLAILGNIYDVEKGSKHYQKGGSYDHFVGKDASRAFVTGDFKNDLNDRIDDLTDSQIADLFNWKNFYDTTYTHIGYLSGRFYDSQGKKTDYLIQMENKVEIHKQYEQVNANFMNRFPPCNSEWTQEKGLVRVWCTTESGGIKRTWSGYPRLVYNPNSKVESCACVNESDLTHPNIKQYPNCQKSTECKF